MHVHIQYIYIHISIYVIMYMAITCVGIFEDDWNLKLKYYMYHIYFCIELYYSVGRLN